MKEQIQAEDIAVGAFPVDAFEYSEPSAAAPYIGLKSGWALKVGGLTLDKDGFVTLKSSADTDAPNNTLYFSLDSSKPAYKDGAGVKHDIY